MYFLIIHYQNYFCQFLKGKKFIRSVQRTWDDYLLWLILWSITLLAIYYNRQRSLEGWRCQVCKTGGNLPRPCAPPLAWRQNKPFKSSNSPLRPSCSQGGFAISECELRGEVFWGIHHVHCSKSKKFEGSALCKSFNQAYIISVDWSLILALLASTSAITVKPSVTTATFKVCVRKYEW